MSQNTPQLELVNSYKDSPVFEIDYRETSDLNIRMLWAKMIDQVVVVATIKSSGEEFEIPVTGEPGNIGHNAREIFWHPMGVAAMLGILPERDVFVADAQKTQAA